MTKKSNLIILCNNIGNSDLRTVEQKYHSSYSWYIRESARAGKAKVTDLVLTGTINSADFTTIKQMTLLKILDISNVDIVDGKYQLLLL